LELVLDTDHDTISTGRLVLESSHYLNFNFYLGIASEPRS
jgi:hypothetical protein